MVKPAQKAGKIILKLKIIYIFWKFSEAQFKQHLEGKKHKKLESVKEEREKAAIRSVFVSGLKRNIFIKHLEEHFEQFGKVNKVIIDKEKVCKRNFLVVNLIK